MKPKLNPKPDFLEILPGCQQGQQELPGNRHNIEEQQQQQQQRNPPFWDFEADILAGDICHGAEIGKP